MTTDATRPLRILVAEDDRFNQRVALGLLRRMGHTVELAADGREAVDAALARPFDVILMDVQMPVMGGIEASRAILRDLPPGRRPHIIALTASALDDERAQCQDAGMRAFLTKPLDPAKLARAFADLDG